MKLCYDFISPKQQIGNSHYDHIAKTSQIYSSITVKRSTIFSFLKVFQKNIYSWDIQDSVIDNKFFENLE